VRDALARFGYSNGDTFSLAGPGDTQSLFGGNPNLQNLLQQQLQTPGFLQNVLSGLTGIPPEAWNQIQSPEGGPRDLGQLSEPSSAAGPQGPAGASPAGASPGGRAGGRKKSGKTKSKSSKRARRAKKSKHARKLHHKKRVHAHRRPVDSAAPAGTIRNDVAAYAAPEVVSSEG
jgi:hypothetical protein